MFNSDDLVPEETMKEAADFEFHSPSRTPTMEGHDLSILILLTWSRQELGKRVRIFSLMLQQELKDIDSHKFNPNQGVLAPSSSIHTSLLTKMYRWRFINIFMCAILFGVSDQLMPLSREGLSVY